MRMLAPGATYRMPIALFLTWVFFSSLFAFRLSLCSCASGYVPDVAWLPTLAAYAGMSLIATPIIADFVLLYFALRGLDASRRSEQFDQHQGINAYHADTPDQKKLTNREKYRVFPFLLAIMLVLLWAPSACKEFYERCYG